MTLRTLYGIQPATCVEWYEHSTERTTEMEKVKLLWDFTI